MLALASGRAHVTMMAAAASGPVHAALDSLMARVTAAAARHGHPEPRLVAVTKSKPAEMVRAAYDKGVRHFGENYVQELAEKAGHPLLSSLNDICWHFIGHLQRKKCNLLLSVPHLWMVETVDSARLASALDSSWHRKYCSEHACHSSKLRVMLQVNTSREETKFGCSPEVAVELARHISQNCHHLEFCGLMTIGAIFPDPSRQESDFLELAKIRDDVCKKLGLEPKRVDLSMGMSADFEEAIAAGSTSIRIGRTIFGRRASTIPQEITD